MIIYKTRLSVMWSLLKPSRAVAIITFALLGLVGNWALAVLTGNDCYRQLWDITEEYVMYVPNGTVAIRDQFTNKVYS